MSTPAAPKLKLALGVLCLAPAPLFLPVLYYSLTTPFALVDDYHQWFLGTLILDSPEHFFQWFRHQFLDVDFPDADLWRPLWELHSAATWKLLGPRPGLHHLARWALHFGSVFAFAAAFLRFPPNTPDAARQSPFLRVLPLALLVHLWLFFPNQPAARLGPLEVNTVFFLGLCTWAMARLLAQRDRPTGQRDRLASGLFWLGFFGLAWSKEINIGVLFWMLVFYYGLFLKRFDRWNVLRALPPVLVFFHTLWRVSQVSRELPYGLPPPTFGSILETEHSLRTALFQVDTSPIIAAGLALLSAALLVFVVAYALRRAGGRPASNEFLFVLFLLGQFASLYLVLCLSWAQTAPRYWYVLVPVFTTLLAFAAKYLLAFAGTPARASARPALRGPVARLSATAALSGFVLFFICCNYSNFLFQTVVQHAARNTEKELLVEVTRLLDEGQYVQVLDFDNDGDELVYNIVRYYREFLPRMHGRRHEIETAPPDDAGRPYYMVVHTGDRQPSRGLLGGYYRPLSLAHDVASFFQMGEPYWTQDAGVAKRSWHVLSTDRNYGHDGLLNISSEDVDDLSVRSALNARFDILRHLREHPISGTLFTNDYDVVLFATHGLAVQVHDGLPCEGSVRRANDMDDVHVAWFLARIIHECGVSG